MILPHESMMMTRENTRTESIVLDGWALGLESTQQTTGEEEGLWNRIL